MKSSTRGNFDSKTARMLTREYNINQTELAQFLGVGRQAITNYLNQSINEGSWIHTNISQKEREIVTKMVKANDFFRESDGLKIRILNNQLLAALLVIDENSKSKVILNLPQDIKELIEDHNFNIFSEQDIKVKKLIRPVNVLGKTYANHDTQLKRFIKKRSEVLQISKKEYYHLHGVEGSINKDTYTDEDIRTLLRTNVTDEGYVSFINSIKDYYKIDHQRKKSGLSISEFIKFYGFEYVPSKKCEEMILTPTIDDKIEELKKIQGDLKLITVKEEKISRSRILVEKLKELYNYRCQLCDKETSIPRIIIGNENYYVEVHHIKALSSVKNNKDDFSVPSEFDDAIDSYKNAIVVCPHHHKFLHYHDGGFDYFKRVDEKLYFKSKKGSAIKVHINYHL